MKKILTLAMMAILCSAMIFAGGSNESAESSDSDSFTIAVAQQGIQPDYATITNLQKYEEISGVHIDWINVPSEIRDERLNLILASGDLPDAFMKFNVQARILQTYGEAGDFLDLSPLLEEHAPNFMKFANAHPDVLASITSPDGKIYSIPAACEAPSTRINLKWFFNQEWLDNLGLEQPTNTEELYQVLKAFKTQDPNGNGDPNDEIPFTFRYSSTDPYNRQQGIQSMFGQFGLLDDIYHFVVEDGQVVYTPTREEYKDAINWFHELYAEGLIDKEVFTHDMNVYYSKIQNPENVVGVWIGWSRNATAAANRDHYVVMAPLMSVDGEQVWRTVDSAIVSKGGFAITYQAEHPEVLMRWIDLSYDQETSIQICQGLLGHSLEKTPEGRYRFMTLPEGMTLDTVIHDFGPGNDGTFGVLQETVDKLDLNANLQERMELDEFYVPYNVPLTAMYPNVLFTEDEINEISVLQTDIDSYVMQKYAQWIVDGGVDAEWDTFQQQLKNMGVDRYIQIYQDACDRYYSQQ